MKKIEKQELFINNVFPIRTDIIPKFVKLDTTTLVHLLMTKNQGNKSEYLTEGNLKKYENKIWKFFFRTERQCFSKPKYSFHHMISTDGISCCILFLRNDMIGKRIPNKKILNSEEYIDELKDYNNIKNKKLIGIDPGKEDLVFCVDGASKDANTFRYSQNSRRKETKLKKYSNIILELKNQKIDNKTIIEYETELSVYNKKSLSIKKFKKYVKMKNKINQKLFKFYENYIFRKLKLNGYMNRKKNEQKMINNFKKIFGKPEDTIITIGDWEQKQHMKYKEATKGKGMRKLFRQNGYKVYLVDEFRTSCKCSNCDGGNCEKFMVRKNPKPYKNNLKLVHGLLSCKNCCNVWNRDCNGASNIYKIAKSAIENKSRPNYLCRYKQSATLNDVV
jgi:transposase